MVNKYFCLTVFILLSQFFYAQEYYYEEYAVKKLGSVNVNQIIQGEDGILWCFTQNGVFSFDGEDFTNYREGLRFSDVSGGVITKDHRFFVISSPEQLDSNGLYEFKDGKFLAMPFDAPEIAEEGFVVIKEGAEGILHILTYESLVIYDYKQQKIIKTYEGLNRAVDFEHFDNEIWVISMCSIYIIDPAKEQAEPYNPLPGGCYYRVTRDVSGNLWIGSNAGRFINISKSRKVTSYKVPGSTGVIFAVISHDDGTVLICTHRDGVYRMDPHGKISRLNPGIKAFTYAYHRMFHDNQGNCWLLPVNPTPSLVKLRTDIYSYPLMKNVFGGRLKNDSVFSYINKFGGVENINLNTGQTYNIPLSRKLDSIPNKVNAYCYLDNELLLGTDIGILHSRDSLYSYIAPEITSPVEKIYPNIEYLLPDEHKTITAYGNDMAENEGFVIRVKEGKVMKEYNRLPVTIIDYMDIIDAGVYFFTYDTGWYELNTLSKDAEYTRISEIPMNSNLLKVGKLKYLFAGSDTLFLVTLYKEQGRSHWDIRKEALKSKDLPAANLTFYAITEPGKVVVSDYNSVYEAIIDTLHKEIKVVRRFGLSESNANINTEEISNVAINDNRLVMTNTENIMVWDLDRKDLYITIPKLKNVSFLNKNRDGEISEYADGVTGNIPYGLVLPYNRNNLSMSFSGSELFLPGSVNYSYKLARDDEPVPEWSDPSGEATVYFPFLSPGNYTFTLKMTNRFGEWQDELLKYSFTISPPFWKTTWFYALLTLTLGEIVFLVLYMIHKNRINNLKHINFLQKDYSNRLLEAQEEERKRVARELHDDVSQSLVILKNQYKDKRIGGQIELLIEDVRRISGNLHPIHINSIGLFNSLKSLVISLNEVSPVYFKYDIVPEIDIYFKKDKALHIYRIVQEGMTNIIRHAEADEAHIKVELKADILQIKISDNGIGFNSSSEVITLGMGLKTMEERVTLLNGKYNILDQKGTNGFAIEFEIPLHREN